MTWRDVTVDGWRMTDDVTWRDVLLFIRLRVVGALCRWYFEMFLQMDISRGPLLLKILILIFCTPLVVICAKMSQYEHLSSVVVVEKKKSSEFVFSPTKMTARENDSYLTEGNENLSTSVFIKKTKILSRKNNYREKNLNRKKIPYFFGRKFDFFLLLFFVEKVSFHHLIVATNRLAPFLWP